MTKSLEFPQLPKTDWLNWIESRKECGLTVNRKYCPQLKNHAILRKLIRKGIIKVVRTGSKFCKRTTLHLA